jgi:alkylation response protein AidB-like acyl-CoA dehydrogenase
MSKSVQAAAEKFGNPTPFTEPYWYQGWCSVLRCLMHFDRASSVHLHNNARSGYHSPYYHAGHRAFRAKVRKFVEEEIKPNIDTWIESPDGYPKALHLRAHQLGLSIYPKEFGGTRPDDYDAFYELVCV